MNRGDEANVRITAFKWVPDFAQGRVRDLRVRWALEEAGIPYSVRKLEAIGERPADYFAEQPWGQVPSYKDDEVQLFESGAIVLHIGRKFGGILPADENGRARATAWVIAALNSVEPFAAQLPIIDIFHRGEEWTKERRPQVVEMIGRRLDRLSDWLGDKQWLEDEFSAGDLLMVDVLRIVDNTDLLKERPNLLAYVERGTARPAFKRAIEAQLADFEQRETQGAL
ncbi:glutathione S-transferase family protein [Sphingomonas sinipercae]|uniref:Glutathione S-transferase family protein n=1 Tax=Sphingomonas sinipercae TaxID=2714944 RepID=A0A6G7ZL66_9SPHN|nr:glutathione S-transferase family protein [Sphingomonas sinipercae]QIL01724.1 glutathione S-transferase family protein [Sphingomonas sinipercae]